MNRKELAIERFRGDYNCAQSVLTVFAAEYGLDEKDAFRIAFPFGGGMGRLQKTCGAVTGALMVIGLARGMTKPLSDEEKEKFYRLVREFVEEFEALRGTSDCFALLEQDIRTVVGRQQFKEKGLSASHCEKFIGEAVTILEDLLAEEDK